MTKTKAIRLLNEMAEKYGQDYPLIELIDAPKIKIAWYRGERLPDNENIYKIITIKDLIDETSQENWNPSDLRDTVKHLQAGNYQKKKMYVRPDDSQKELEKFEEENKELCEKRQQDARKILGEYMRFANKPILKF